MTQQFSLSSIDQALYQRFPMAPRQPIIGITTNYEGVDATLRDRYYKQIVAAGGVPVLIPPVANAAVMQNTLDHIDGLLLTGGGDVNPLWAGEEPAPTLHNINAERDEAELVITRLAARRQLPVLGICRGVQVMVVALGGTVAQDLSLLSADGAGKQLKHSQDARREEPTHSVTAVEGGLIHRIFGRQNIFVNSFHHQAVADGGSELKVSARAADGVIEAVESRHHKALLGVQWHPEWMGEQGLPLFQWLVDEAKLFARAKGVHAKTLTLDTHCDTPMFFPEGVEFAQRDSRILVDLHKMTEGCQDAVTMVAYLPQPKMGERFSDKIDLAGIRRHNPDLSDKYMAVEPAAAGRPERLSITPAAYTDLIFDKIEAIVEANSTYLSIARTPADLYADKRHGRKSIMLGIENGLAIGRDMALLRHFAQRGIVYMTLCHNGDNDICDSARGCNTHGGVSQWGAKVIEEMNRLGVMVDLSHGGEKSFYDALQISRQPIVCSHSNAKALCDVPRNLTDDQLRALAAHGGVAHTTLYGGFLRQTGEASIVDAVAHLEHAIGIMGIDHVGLGTDFDGDGGVSGLKDSSEMINFTLHLLRRRYSEADIAKIWGGNWLRVMSQVQAARTM